MKQLQIQICAADEARTKVNLSRLPWRKPFGSVVSIENPGQARAAQHFKTERALTKHGFAPRLNKPQVDQTIITFEDSHDYYVRKPVTQTHVMQIMQALEHHCRHRPQQKILLHCAKGIARSPAAALTMMVAWHWATEQQCSPAMLVHNLLTMRPQAAPDRALIGLTDQTFDLRGALINAVANNTRITDNRIKHQQRFTSHRL